MKLDFYYVNSDYLKFLKEREKAVPVSSKLHYKQDDMLIKGKDKKSSYLGTLRFDI